MIVNFGSINVDHVYQVPHMPAAGETLAATAYDRHLGGKGINQSIAIVRAGGAVCHVGQVGPDGAWALEQIQSFGVDTGRIVQVAAPTGHAVIMVDARGENQIVIASGANLELTSNQIAEGLDAQSGADNWVLIQNEMTRSHEIAEAARKRGYRVALAAAPFVAEDVLPLIGMVDLLAVNEIEAAEFSAALGTGTDKIPVSRLLVTRGAEGAQFTEDGATINQAAFPVTPVDTTGAGDTFLGAFLAKYAAGKEAGAALEFAAAASALQVTRPGAASAIPTAADTETFLQQQHQK